MSIISNQLHQTLSSRLLYKWSNSLFVAYSLALIFFIFPLAVHAQYSVIHEFDGTHGAHPFNYEENLVLVGDVLYGMTLEGGNDDLGTIFKINTNGTGFGLLHEFEGGNDDGSYPNGSLTLSGNTLFGMTTTGGNDDAGTIFKINTDGTGFALLREFTGGTPYGSLTLSGNTLFGMTYNEHDVDFGTIFKINTDGTGFSLLHEFAGGNNDGKFPAGSLTLSGNTLFGMTTTGGDDDLGTIFKINTDGTGFSLLHEFVGGNDDGSVPYGSLILSENTLFGMTTIGGDDDLGTIFKINTDGTGFVLLYEFAGSDGSEPYGSLTLSGTTLFGTTYYGGNEDVGVLFKINTDGTGFALLHQIGAPDGAYTSATLILSGETLYGGTAEGGIHDFGTLFSYLLPDSTPPGINLDSLPASTTSFSIDLTGTATDARSTVTSVEYQINGTGGDWTTCSAVNGAFDSSSEPFKCTISGLTLGANTIYVRATDSNGNTTSGGGESTKTITVILSPTPTSTPTPTPTPSPPEILTLSQIGNTSTIDGVNTYHFATGKNLTFKGTSSPNAIIVLVINSDPVTCETQADAQGNWSCTFSEDIPDGYHTLSISAYYPGGGILSTQSYTLGIGSLAQTGRSTLFTLTFGFLLLITSLSVQTKNLTIFFKKTRVSVKRIPKIMDLLSWNK